ncbi:MAG: aminotransferase class V-fold PLP-dependent enzyme [Actinobacteria bacterium]|nr:aminotransferase class V-fold PLP-dependent enzyme [Actinomycetota bacterium]MTA89505.1 aminotransferase class V-fold PLP-dependent enzyme [Actinomycetota bacterium]
MHNPQSADSLRKAIFDYASQRFDYNPPPLDGPLSPAELKAKVGQTITEDGLGGEKALNIFAEQLAPATISTDHPGFLSFIPAAPTEAASLFDLVVSASSVYGGSWLEGAGAVYAENQVLSFLAGEYGLPETSGGVFVQGGTLGNLSALAVAREEAAKKLGKKNWTIICSEEAHSSIQAVAMVLGIETTKAASGDSGSIGYDSAKAAALEATSAGLTPMAIVGTAGTTNFGIIDDLAGLAKLAKELGIWYHVDGAYGLAGALIPELRAKFNGIEQADSFIVDPHKWLFAPFDACALVYRNPQLARKTFSQHGEYLEPINKSTEWNPSDYAFNLSRRARGLPLWFSLATYGAAKYRSALKQNVDLAFQIAAEIEKRPSLRLVRQPQLSVVVFERIGWEMSDYEKWSEKLLADQIAFVLPSSLRGKPHTRFAIVNPQTSFELLVEILDSMEK